MADVFSNLAIGIVTVEVIDNQFQTLMRELDTTFLGNDRQWRKDLILARVEKAKADILKHVRTSAREAIKENELRRKAPELEPAKEEQSGYDKWKQRTALGRQRSTEAGG